MERFKSAFSNSSILLLTVIARPAFGQVQYVGKVLFTMTTPTTFVGTALPQPWTTFTQPATNGQAVASMSDPTTFSQSHAFLWTGPGNPIDLQPTDPSFFSSGAVGTNGSQQVGWTSTRFASGTMDAAYWNGTANSMVSLKPNLPGIVNSYAFFTSGNQQIGVGLNNLGTASYLLWDSTAASARVMPGVLNATNGTEQVGTANAIGDSTPRPFVYKGTANSAIDLTPAQFSSIVGGSANGISPTGKQIVGNISTSDGVVHAMRWGADGATATDITPTNLPGVIHALALATNGVTIAGIGIVVMGAGEPAHALVWVNGDPANVIDLNGLLPGTFLGSEVYSVDADGNIFGFARSTGATAVWSAVEWSPVPEPSAALLLFTGAALLQRRR